MWHTNKVNELINKETAEEKVKNSMDPSNLKIETRLNNKWEMLP